MIIKHELDELRKRISSGSKAIAQITILRNKLLQEFRNCEILIIFKQSQGDERVAVKGRITGQQTEYLDSCIYVYLIVSSSGFKEEYRVPVQNILTIEKL